MMRTSRQMLYCSRCKRPTEHLVEEPNHVLHAILSLLTAGLWLFVWLIVVFQTRSPEGRARCTACGSLYTGAGRTRLSKAERSSGWGQPLPPKS